MNQDEQSFIKFLSDTRYSRIPSEFPDKNYYRKYYNAEKIEITIHPGEYIFIPSDWFHFVFSEETSGKHDVNLAVNFWYKKTRENSESIYPYTNTHDIKINLDEYKDDVITVSESSCNFFLANHFKMTNFFENISVKEYKSTMSKFIKKRYPYTYIQQNIMKYPVIPPSNDIEGDLMLVNFWINFGNVSSQLHCDGYDNILCQIEGTKRIILFNPNQRDNLYLYNHYNIDFVKKVENAFISHKCDNSFILHGNNTHVNEIVKKYSHLLYDKQVLPGYHISNKPIVKMNIYRNTMFKNNSKSKYSLFIIENGIGVIIFKDGSIYKIEKGDFIIFPDSIFYQYKIETEEMNILYYPINYNNTDNYNKTFLNVFVKEDACINEVPKLIDEANEKLFNFELFGNKLKYDMIIDSQCKLWVFFIKNGSVKLDDTEYSKKNTIIICPVYKPVKFNGDVEAILVRGPPFI